MAHVFLFTFFALTSTSASFFHYRFLYRFNVLVYALLEQDPATDDDDILLTNENVVENIRISSEDALLREEVDVVEIDPTLIVERAESFDDTGDFLIPDPNIMEKGYMTPNNTKLVDQMELGEANSTTVFNLTITGNTIALLNLYRPIEALFEETKDLPIEDINKTLVVTGFFMEEDEDGELVNTPFALAVSACIVLQGTPSAPTALEIIGTEASPTEIFATLDLDYQEDVFNDEAEARIKDQCSEFLQGTDSTLVASAELSKVVPFNAIDLTLDDNATVVLSNNTNVTVLFSFEAKFAVYVKVRAQISIKKRFAELEFGGGYDYLLSAKLEKSKGKKKARAKDLWKGKDSKVVLFTVGPLPVFITWQPFVAYDFDFDISILEDTDPELGLRYETRGGDYAALVINTNTGLTTKRVEKPRSETDEDKIVSFNNECPVVIEAGVGIRAGLRVKFFGKKDYSSDPAIRAGIDFNGKLQCDGSLEQTPNRFNDSKYVPFYFFRSRSAIFMSSLFSNRNFRSMYSSCS